MNTANPRVAKLQYADVKLSILILQYYLRLYVDVDVCMLQQHCAYFCVTFIGCFQKRCAAHLQKV